MTVIRKHTYSFEQQAEKNSSVIFLLVLICLLSLVSCTQNVRIAAETDEASFYSIDSDYLEEWLGFYSFRGNFPKDNDSNSGYISMELIIYQENGAYWGYLNMNGTDDTYTHYYDRILVDVQGTKDAIQAFFVKGYADGEDQGDMFSNYPAGSLLFSLKKEESNITTEWEEMQLDLQKEDLTRGFIQREELVSVILRDETDRAGFLKAFGIMEETTPFYQYYNDDGELYLELYYDIEKGAGAGVFHGIRSMSGFDIGACESGVWQDHMFSVITEEHDASSLANYEEYYTYDESGKPTSFYSEGIIEEWADSPYLDKAVEIEFTYRDDGTLERKRCYYNPHLFGTTRSSETYFYDANERLVFTSAYITHGTLEDYYIYEGSSKEPSYRLTLDHMGWNARCAGFVQYGN